MGALLPPYGAWGTFLCCYPWQCLSVSARPSCWPVHPFFIQGSMNWKDSQLLLFFIALIVFLPKYHESSTFTLSLHLTNSQLHYLPRSAVRCHSHLPNRTRRILCPQHLLPILSPIPATPSRFRYHLPWESAFGLLDPFFPFLSRPNPSCPAGPSNMSTLDSAIVI